ncbi:MAG: metallophosphoesterase family protein [Povalibacter sp.]
MKNRSERNSHSGPAESSGLSRRQLLKCGAWAGTGLIWAIEGGVPTALLMSETAQAKQTGALTFVQISDSHIGFNKEANPDPAGTLATAIEHSRALNPRPAFMLHTGDVSHLSKPEEFDTAQQIINEFRGDVHYVPGEHDVIGDNGIAFFSRFNGSPDRKWYSFDAHGVHFVALVNVLDLQAGGFGRLGAEQLEWLERDLKGLPASTPIILFTHMPLWAVYPDWGWGTDDALQALGYVRRFGSVTVLNGHIHQVLQKVEGHVSFYSAMSTAFPQPAPGTAPSPGPMKVPADKLRSVLGIRDVVLLDNHTSAKVIDQPLNVT